jgi:hypothetical protein
MASKKTVELRKAKEKRQKMIVIGGAVILVAVLAIQLPKLMSHPSPKTTPIATGTSSTATAASAAATATAAASTAVVLVSSDVPAEPGPGQLVVFNHFQSKDPFVQQLSDQTSAGSASSSATASPTTAAAQTAPKTAVTSSSPASVTATVISPATTSTTTTGKTIVISTNGKAEHVTVGASFPTGAPLFLLVSATNSSAQIAVAGGSYADGSPTVKLTKGKPLTLMDTNTNEKYVLIFISG